MDPTMTQVVFIHSGPEMESKIWNGPAYTPVEVAAREIGLLAHHSALLDWEGRECSKDPVSAVPQSRVFVVDGSQPEAIPAEVLLAFESPGRVRSSRLLSRFGQPGILTLVVMAGLAAVYSLCILVTAGLHWFVSLLIIEVISAIVVGLAAARHLARNAFILTAIIAIGTILGAVLVRGRPTTMFVTGTLLLTPIPFAWCFLRSSIRERFDRATIIGAITLTIMGALALRDFRVPMERHWQATLIGLANTSWLIIAIRQGLSDRRFLKAWSSS